MEGMDTQHATGFTCSICGGTAVVDVDDGYLCAAHAIEALITIEIDLRAEENRSSPSRWADTVL
jgi:hypothetical protein